MQCLERSASVVAAGGNYAHVDRMNVGADNFKVPQSVSMIAKGDIAMLAAKPPKFQTLMGDYGIA